MPRLLRRDRPRLLLALLLAAVFLSAPSVAGAVTRTWVSVEDGTTIDADWTDCTPQEFEIDTAGPQNARPQPAVGENVDDSDVVVVAFRRDGSTATWTLAPSPELCAFGEADPSLSDATLRLRWSARRYVVRAGERSGIRSFAGFRVDDLRHRPTAKAARRAFGRPSSIKRDSLGCAMRWGRLGLVVSFVNYGGYPPCTRGYFQAAFITDPTKWSIVVGSRPGIVETSQPNYLLARGRAEAAEGDGWSLAQVYVPFGEPGYYPSIGAHAEWGGEITGYDFWVGAGGD